MQADPKRRTRKPIYDIILVSTVTLLLIVLYQFIFHVNSNEKESVNELELLKNESIETIRLNKYGFNAANFYLEESTFDNNQFLGDILYKNGISYGLIAELEEKAKDIFDVRRIRSGNKYALVREDSCDQMVAIVYEPDPLRYVLYDFRDSISVNIQDREYTTCVEIASGKLESSLWNAVVGKGYKAALVDLMEDALASSVDFYHTQKGDEYKVIYEKNYIDGKPSTLGRVLGAYYKNARGKHYSLYFKSENYEGFFDDEGRPSKKSFLRSPVKYTRISSRFSYARFHPIKKRRIPHLGTDYAAPRGTPIRAVSDGVVVAASYTRANGKYIKIKHDRTYTTQYLHMNKFSKGMVPGQTVKRDETIGYVGSTGLATGPHVCFRFWKNGKQVDFQKENFPPPNPMPEEYLPAFYVERDNIVKYLNQIAVQDSEPRVVATSSIDINT